MRHALGVAFVGCAAALICIPAHASTTFASFSIQPVTQSVAQGGTGAFDVVVTDNGPGNLLIGGFAFEVTVDAGVTLIGADFSTGATYPYIFAGDSFDIDNGFTLYTDPTLPSQTVDGSDVTDPPPFGAGPADITLTSGESLALGDILFSVSPTTALGLVNISFTGGSSVADSNNLASSNGNAVPVLNFTGGTINVIANTSVPEPSSILLTLAGAGALAGWARRKRRDA